MITIKHFLDTADPGDGQRIWVEPIGLTRDLREWCKVDHVMPHLGPPTQLWEWFHEHPDGYEYFRGSYHEMLGKGPYRAALQQLACAGMRENFTLVHDGDDREHNTAAALHEFLSELEAYCPREESRRSQKKQKESPRLNKEDHPHTNKQEPGGAIALFGSFTFQDRGNDRHQSIDN